MQLLEEIQKIFRFLFGQLELIFQHQIQSQLISFLGLGGENEETRGGTNESVNSCFPAVIASCW